MESTFFNTRWPVSKRRFSKAELIDQRTIVDHLESVIMNLRADAAYQRRVTHSKHICPHFWKAIDTLESKLGAEQARLMSMQILYDMGEL